MSWLIQTTGSDIQKEKSLQFLLLQLVLCLCVRDATCTALATVVGWSCCAIAVFVILVMV